MRLLFLFLFFCIVLRPLSVFATWDLNDVSVLMPLPRSGEENLMWGTQTRGGKGELLPTRVVSALPRITTDLDPRTLYTQALKVVSIRLDPCFSEGISVRSCQRQVRLVFQPLVFEERRWLALDAAFHIFFALTEDEWSSLLRNLRPQGGPSPTSGLPLQVHPLLAREGFRGTFWKSFSQAVLPFLGESRLVRATAMSVNPLGNVWFFAGVNIQGRSVQPFSIPRVDEKIQGFLVDAGTMGNADFRATASPAPSEDQALRRLLFDSRSARQELSEKEIQAGVREAIRLQNPRLHHTGTADCVSCHVSPTISFWAAQNFPRWNWANLFSKEIFRGGGNLAPTASHGGRAHVLRAFGYFETDPIISPRTIHETSEVVRMMLQGTQERRRF